MGFGAIKCDIKAKIFSFLLFITPSVFLSPSLLSPAFISSPFSVLNRSQIYFT